MLREIGTEQEEAAATLGASAFTTFRRITLPAIRWAVAYGVVLTTARCARRVRRRQRRLRRDRRPDADADAVRAGVYEKFDQTGAYAASVLLAALAILTLVADDDVPTEGGRTWRSRLVTSPSASATSSRSTTSRSTVAERLADRAARPERQRQVDAAARDRRASRRRTRARVHLRQGGDGVAPQKRGVGFVFQHYAPFTHMTVAENVAFGLKIRQAAEGRDRASGSTSCSSSCSSRGSASATRRSSPAASGSAWRWRARSRRSPRCCCSTSRSARSTRACASSCASGCSACTTRCT